MTSAQATRKSTSTIRTDRSPLSIFDNSSRSVIMLSSQAQYGIALQTVQKGAEQYVLKGRDQFDQIDRIVQEMLS